VNDLDVLQRAGVPHDREVFKPKGEFMSRTLEWVAIVLVVIGAINWGLVGLAQFDLVATLFGGQDAPLSRIVYGLVGLAGVALLALRSRHELAHSAA
jgi:hypothetical protein